MTVNAPPYSYPQFSIPTAGRLKDQEPLIERHGLEYAEPTLSSGRAVHLPKASKQSSGVLKKTLYTLLTLGGIGALAVNHKLNIQQAIAQQKKTTLPDLPMLAAGGGALTAAALGVAHVLTKKPNVYSPPTEGILQRLGITKGLGQAGGYGANTLNYMATPTKVFGGAQDIFRHSANAIMSIPAGVGGAIKGIYIGGWEGCKAISGAWSK